VAKEIEAKKEDTEGWCQNCRLTFDITDDDVQVVTHPRNGNCLIVVDGKAHSLLMGKSWEELRRRMANEDHALAINRYDHSDPVEVEREESTEDQQVISLEDFKSGKMINPEVEP
jgi:hypothetical protein